MKIPYSSMISRFAVDYLIFAHSPMRESSQQNNHNHLHSLVEWLDELFYITEEFWKKWLCFEYNKYNLLFGESLAQGEALRYDQWNELQEMNMDGVLVEESVVPINEFVTEFVNECVLLSNAIIQWSQIIQSMLDLGLWKL